MKVTTIILAGGKNLRLGNVKSKALQPVGGKSLIECVAERVRPLSNQIIIVTSREQFNLMAVCRAEILVDLYPGKGPLGGIYTGLLAAHSSHSLVVACDMPFLNTELLGYLIKLSADFDAVIPMLGEGKTEPLHAVYSKNCLDSMKTQLDRNELAIDSIFSTVSVKYVKRAECQRLDPQLLSFFNINDHSDLERAVAQAAASSDGLL